MSIIADDAADLLDDPTLIDPDAGATEAGAMLAKLGTEAERALVAQALHSEAVLAAAHKHFPPEALQELPHKLILRQALAHWERTGKLIPKPILKARVKEETKESAHHTYVMGELQVLADYTPTTNYDDDSYIDLIKTYARQHTIGKAIKEYLDKGRDPEILFRATDEVRQTSAAKTGYQLYTFDDLDAQPPLTWQIADHFPKNSTVTIFGSSGVGKSFLCLDMALSIAHGVPFHKWDTVQGNVLYLCSEGSYGLPSRYGAWFEARGVTRGPNIIFSTTCHDLQDRDEADELVRRALAMLPGGQVDLVVVDTLSRNFGGGDTDKNADMRAYLSTIDHIRQTTGATLLNVHHTGWNDVQRERGAKALRDYSDTSICVSAEEDGTISVSCKKQKDAAEFVPYLVSKTTVGSSLVLDMVGTRAEARAAAEDKAEAARMSELLAFVPDIPLGADPTEATSVTQRDAVNTLHFRRATVSAAFDRWATDGVIQKGKLGASKSANVPFRYWRCSAVSH